MPRPLTLHDVLIDYGRLFHRAPRADGQPAKPLTDAMLATVVLLKQDRTNHRITVHNPETERLYGYIDMDY